MSTTYGVQGQSGVRTAFGVAPTYGVRGTYGVGSDVSVSATTSTLTSSAGSFVAGGAGVTLTFTARDTDGNVVAGYTPIVEAGVS